MRSVDPDRMFISLTNSFYEFIKKYFLFCLWNYAKKNYQNRTLWFIQRIGWKTKRHKVCMFKYFYVIHMASRAYFSGRTVTAEILIIKENSDWNSWKYYDETIAELDMKNKNTRKAWRIRHVCVCGWKCSLTTSIDQFPLFWYWYSSILRLFLQAYLHIQQILFAETLVCFRKMYKRSAKFQTFCIARARSEWSPNKKKEFSVITFAFSTKWIFSRIFLIYFCYYIVLRPLVPIKCSKNMKSYLIFWVLHQESVSK